ncbi:MAG: HD domain-containing phosphohydrolase [Aquabacterium sp.]
MSSPAPSAVNVHYLDHVMTVAEERQVEATEDIYSENGMKLVAKGYAINKSMRERLIEHKLIKPLEDCMAVSDGVTGARCGEAAEKLLDTYPVLRAMCISDRRASPVKLIADTTTSGRLQTLLTVYAEHLPGKLEHAVCVALVALNLAQRMKPGEADLLNVLLVSSLAHDVGELYIDPQYLQKGAKLGPVEWRHIAAHPVIAHNLLKDLNGLARHAAPLIMDHHERLDGFGYPVGKGAGQVADLSQLLGVAEMLGGMMERGHGVLQQADVAVKLIYGEFSRPIIDVVSKTFKECREVDAGSDADNLRDALQMSRQLGERLQRILQVEGEYRTLFERASPPFKALLAQSHERFGSIRRAWSSTGLDVQPDGAWLLQESPAMQREVAIILKEIRWRLRELQREFHARVIRHAGGDLPVLERFLKDVNTEAPADEVATAATPD